MDVPTPLLELACACGSLRRATRAVTRTYAWELRGTGLNPTRFTLLQALDRLGPSTQRALGEALAIQTCTLSRVLPPLERYSWIRSIRGSDPRQTRWELTVDGLARMVAASHAWKGAQGDLRAQLNEEVWVPLARKLGLVTAGAQIALVNFLDS